jgi:hypothetical protein
MGTQVPLKVLQALITPALPTPLTLALIPISTEAEMRELIPDTTQPTTVLDTPEPQLV